VDTMHFLYPADMLKPRLPDESYREEARALQAHGHHITLVDSLTIATMNPNADMTSSIIYRGWMVTPEEYQQVLDALEQEGAKAYTSLEQYTSTHYLPKWYPLLDDLTPETVILDPAADLIPVLTQIGWPRYFIKDYVKSLKTAGGSVIDRPEEIERVVAEMLKYRGRIEGGLCVRRFEEFVPDSECRYFVVNGSCYGSDPRTEIPSIVQECTARLTSPFFSVDVALNTDGRERIVEVGDGQVSDLVGWTCERFAELWQ
jgi:hypothetical protein